MLKVILTSFIMTNAILRNVITMIAVGLNVILRNFITLRNARMKSVPSLNVIMLIVIKLNTLTLEFNCAERQYLKCHCVDVVSTESHYAM